MSWVRFAALAALSLVACTGEGRVSGRETWIAPPAVRIAVLVRDGKVVEVSALGANDAFRALVDAKDRELPSELWLLGYSEATLRAVLPGLPPDPASWPALLKPRAAVTSGQVAPEADEVLRSEVVSGEELTYGAQLWADWLVSPGGRAGLRFDVDAGAVCGGVSTRSLILPADFRALGLAAISPTSALILGTMGTQPDARLVRVDGPQVRLLDVSIPNGTPAVPQLARPVWDAQNSSFWTVGAAGRLIRVGSNGTLEPTGEPAMRPAGQLCEFGIGLDGATYAMFGNCDLSPPQGYLFRLEEGAWVRVTAADPNGRDGVIAGLRIDRRSRILFFRACWVHGNAVAMGPDQWKNAGLDPGCSVEGLLTTLADWDLDDDMGIAVGARGHVTYGYDVLPGASTWAVLPFRRVDFAKVVAVGQRQAVAVTTTGQVALIREGNDCPLDSVGGAPQAVGRVRGTAMIVSELPPLGGVPAPQRLTIIDVARPGS